MGLGKTLQSLCILAGDHCNRNQAYQVNKGNKVYQVKEGNQAYQENRNQVYQVNNRNQAFQVNRNQVYQETIGTRLIR